MVTFRAPSRDSAALRFSGSKRVGWRRGRVFPTECVESYPMVGMSPSFRPETRKSLFSLLWATFRGNSDVFLFQGSLENVQLGSRRSQEVRGSPELQNGGLRALEEAWDDFLLEAFFCQVWSSSVLLGHLRVAPGASSCVPGVPRRSGEAQNSRTVA